MSNFPPQPNIQNLDNHLQRIPQYNLMNENPQNQRNLRNGSLTNIIDDMNTNPHIRQTNILNDDIKSTSKSNEGKPKKNRLEDVIKKGDKDSRKINRNNNSFKIETNLSKKEYENISVKNNEKLVKNVDKFKEESINSHINNYTELNLKQQSKLFNSSFNMSQCSNIN